MVGIELDPEDDVVPPIRKALEDATLAATLRLRQTPEGKPYARPSTLFVGATSIRSMSGTPAWRVSMAQSESPIFFFRSVIRIALRSRRVVAGRPVKARSRLHSPTLS